MEPELGEEAEILDDREEEDRRVLEGRVDRDLGGPACGGARVGDKGRDSASGGGGTGGAWEDLDTWGRPWGMAADWAGHRFERVWGRRLPGFGNPLTGWRL